MPRPLVKTQLFNCVNSQPLKATLSKNPLDKVVKSINLSHTTCFYQTSSQIVELRKASVIYDKV